MTIAHAAISDSLYEQDETAWLELMADLIQQGRLDELDYAHLAEHLSDMAKRDRREVQSRLAVLLQHLLKWKFQPAHRTGSWKATILEEQDQLEDLAEGVLRNHAIGVMAQMYAKALKRAASETGLPEETFPTTCPYSIDQLLSDDILAD